MKTISFCIYYNSRCSKSKQTLELLKLKTKNFIVIEYLKIKINKDNLEESLNYLDVPIHNVIRDNEITYKKMKVNKIELSVNEILELIIQSPITLQRPLITKYVNSKAIVSIISRPPEKIISL